MCNGSVIPAYPLGKPIFKLPQHLTLISACACSKAPGARCTAYKTKRGSSQRSGEMCSMAPALKVPCPHTYHHVTLLYIQRIQHFHATPNGKTDWNATKQVSQNPSRSIQPQQSFRWTIQLTRLIWWCRWWLLSFFYPFATSALESVYALYILFTLHHFCSLWFQHIWWWQRIKMHEITFIPTHPRLFLAWTAHGYHFQSKMIIVLQLLWGIFKSSTFIFDGSQNDILANNLQKWCTKIPGWTWKIHTSIFESFAVFTIPSNLMRTQSSNSLSVKTWSSCIPIGEDFPEKLGEQFVVAKFSQDHVLLDFGRID